MCKSKAESHARKKTPKSKPRSEAGCPPPAGAWALRPHGSRSSGWVRGPRTAPALFFFLMVVGTEMLRNSKSPGSWRAQLRGTRTPADAPAPRPGGVHGPRDLPPGPALRAPAPPRPALQEPTEPPLGPRRSTQMGKR